MKCKLGLSVLAVAAATSAWAVESTDPIKLTLHDWSGQLINTKIMGSILEEAGYNVEYVQADYIAQFAGLKTGDLHLAMEIWETTGREALDEATASGNVVNVGETGLMAIEEWWYPSYMKERCPGLPNWEALRDCAEEFSTAETAPSGRYVGGPVTWGGFDEERVEALELDFEVVHAGTDAALFAELESAYQRQDPIVLWVYVPHWAPAKYEGEFVEFPPFSAECYSDPSVGVNPDMAYDCGKPRGPIWKAAWSGLQEKWPGAYDIIEAYNINNDEMSAMVGKADLDGVEIDSVVSEWMETNKDRWSGWISK
ncbi:MULTISPECIES: ABC transporter substrate-binding protein [unclassified Ruegeria]|uniref:ABC transporter substrate-binding protein n=1 Tax=unclassified Ruegeria TaxID=2625375 RepID=UPI0014882783|nr:MULTISPECIES: ABC transporter substrate-binding protein [unclassified Ruegeria]NOD76795.1 ABC transporter [Ruegeria sp. HKCCD4332]NOD88305.1 ABC transporter [Ruegeria sp. HKCCD4318]NOE13214.1 ABC transporter [Ruegeria sp. HKCCD4318-2]NOG11244.1 ABC transporter substrate-binding protein [Ruegeria sp. HKCCD4315]